ncbi:penicillin acylase family protein [soil metagenome]
MDRSMTCRGRATAAGAAGVVAGLLMGACAPVTSTLFAPRSYDERLAREVTITRDEWGVPHVHGVTDASTAFGVAYAQAEDAYLAIEEAYIHALGRAAYWYGEEHVEADLARAAFEVERLAREEYAREPAERQAVWSAYAVGLNYYRRTHTVPVRAIGAWEPWMLFARLRAERVTHPPAGDVASLSFAAAVAPDRTAAGRALLLHARDHAFADAAQSYELHLHSDEGWHVAGVATAGMPVPRAGHSERLAWAQTWTGAADTAAADVAAIREWQDTILVNTHEGVVERVYTFRSTADGRVRAERDGQTVELRIDRAAAGGSLQQWYELGRARDLADVDAALELDARPALGTVVADTAGNILAVHGGTRTLNPAAGTVFISAVPAGMHPFERLSAADTTWTIDAWAAAVFDTYAADADVAIRRLVLEWEQVGGTNPERAMQLDTVLARLRAWDRHITLESTAAALYVSWQRQLRGEGYDEAYGLFRALEDAAARLEREWPDGDPEWGAVNRLQRLRPDVAGFNDDWHSVAVAAAPWWTGAGSNFLTERGPATRRRYGVRGYAWAGAVELAPVPVARSVAVFGQSTQPDSPHFFDQAALYAAAAMKTLPFTRDDVAAGARRTYRPGEAR